MENFKNIETRLNNAINKVDQALKDFNEGKRKDVDNWNKFHDLRYRLEERRKDNLSNFYDWHWEKYGFNLYSM